MFLASSASLASSGAIRKNLLHALGLRVMPMRPPETFVERYPSKKLKRKDHQPSLFQLQVKMADLYFATKNC